MPKRKITFKKKSSSKKENSLETDTQKIIGTPTMQLSRFALQAWSLKENKEELEQIVNREVSENEVTSLWCTKDHAMKNYGGERMTYAERFKRDYEAHAKEIYVKCHEYCIGHSSCKIYENNNPLKDLSECPIIKNGELDKILRNADLNYSKIKKND